MNTTNAINTTEIDAGDDFYATNTSNDSEVSLFPTFNESPYAFLSLAVNGVQVEQYITLQVLKNLQGKLPKIIANLEKRIPPDAPHQPTAEELEDVFR